MNRGWIRASGFVGIAGVAVALATLPMQGSPPKSSAPASVVTGYVVQHQHALRVVGLLVVLSAALLAWFAGSFSWLLSDSDRRSPLGAIAAVAAAGMVTFLAWDGILEVALSFAARQSHANSPGISVLYLLENGIVMPGAYGFLVAAFLVTVAVAALRGIVARPWVAYLSLVLAALSVAGGFLGLSTIDGGTSSPVSFAPAISTSIVIVILSIFLLRQRSPEHHSLVEHQLVEPTGA